MKKDIKVSVICVTYNHEKYIRAALDSILAQKTDFGYEILVGEDCSDDGTRSILMEYEQAYPDMFRMYYRDKNLGATRNEYELMMDAKGDYIAALELDDIWTDENKLQKQYDFLNEHSEYVGVAHDFEIIDKDGNIIENDDNKKVKSFFGKSFTLADFLNEGFVFQTGTHFYRNIFKDGKDYSIIYTADRLIRDKTILSLLLDRGDFYILPDTMSAYRRYFDPDAVNGRNVTNANMEQDLFDKAHHVQALNEYFEGRIDYSRQWSDIIWDYGKRSLKRRKGFKISRFFQMYRNADRKTKRMVRQEIDNSLGRSRALNLFKIVLFLVVFLFLLRSVSYIMRTNGDTKDRFAGFYAEKNNSIEVLLIGSSTVGTSLNAPYMWHNYGFTSYPLSSNSMRPKAIKYLIEEGRKYQSPSLIVIEMRTFIADDDEMATDEGHVREVVDNMKYSVNRIRAIDALADHFDDKIPFYIDIIKYHSNWGALLQWKEWSKFDYRDKSIKKGFEIKTREQLFREGTDNRFTEERLPIPFEQEKVLLDLLDYLKKENLNALFVVTPRADLEDYEKQMNYCSDIIKDAGFEFLDLNYRYEEMGFDFRYDLDDGAHTNVWGALKCSDAVGRYISENYELKKNYTHTTINEWDRAYDYFEKELEELEKEK